jgi:N-acetylglucosaminyldiphosphoundecaprenol N-acetyl-beta-D-mannosaminyltransferase
MNKKIEIAGIKFDPVTYDLAIEAVSGFMSGGGRRVIVTPNPEMVLDAHKNKEFADVLNGASLSVADGMGILWASYYLNLPKKKTAPGRLFQIFSSLSDILSSSRKIRKIFPERVTGSDIFEKIIEKSQSKKWRIFLLGAGIGVGKKAVDNLLKKYPGAVFAGSYSGSPGENEENDICRIINSAKPDVLFVAYGSPAQELWISRNFRNLTTVRLAMGVGGAIDFAAGKIKRAPRFMQKTGLEWLWRLSREPGRVKRIWKATYVFIKFISKIKNQKPLS